MHQSALKGWSIACSGFELNEFFLTQRLASSYESAHTHALHHAHKASAGNMFYAVFVIAEIRQVLLHFSRPFSYFSNSPLNGNE